MDLETPALAPPRPEQSPIDALERALLAALERPPCLLAFSGGRDSSALLALATRVARRDGLPDPVPATLRVRGAPRSEEPDWQELVLRHVGLDDWVRIELTDDLDFVGVATQKVLRRHGLLWPANLHFFVPLLEAAAGGSLITGVGGDIVLASGYDDIMGHSRVRRTARMLARGVFWRLPEPARRRYIQRRLSAELPWLRPAALEMTATSLLRAPREPAALDARLGHIYRQRPQVLMRYGLDLLARDEGALIVHPLTEPGFLSALAGVLRRRGLGGRTAVTRGLFADLLPEEVVSRPTKASFAEAFCGPHTRELVRSWDGRGLDPSLVDADRLREHWGDGNDMMRLGVSAMLLHAVWLAQDTGITQPVVGVL
jgi:asparagine synthase (glutamine-hydrolysing)